MSDAELVLKILDIMDQKSKAVKLQKYEEASDLRNKERELLSGLGIKDNWNHVSSIYDYIEIKYKINCNLFTDRKSIIREIKLKEIGI
jgi:hypothetical protein